VCASRVECKWLACGPADATDIPVSFASSKCRMLTYLVLVGLSVVSWMLLNKCHICSTKLILTCSCSVEQKNRQENSAGAEIARCAKLKIYILITWTTHWYPYRSGTFVQFVNKWVLNPTTLVFLCRTWDHRNLRFGLASAYEWPGHRAIM